MQPSDKLRLELMSKQTQALANRFAISKLMSTASVQSRSTAVNVTRLVDSDGTVLYGSETAASELTPGQTVLLNQSRQIVSKTGTQ